MKCVVECVDCIFLKLRSLAARTCKSFSVKNTGMNYSLTVQLYALDPTTVVKEVIGLNGHLVVVNVMSRFKVSIVQ